MYDQPRYEPFEESEFFSNRRSARPVVEGTVARGRLRTDEHFYTGMVRGEFATTVPFPITEEVLKRGQERYDIYCSPCHDRTGSGEGIIVRRGFPPPPSLHIDRLREAPPGHFFDAMTNGFGRMYSYATRVSPRDRWAIVAYIRALQLSQNVPFSDLTQQERSRLQENNQNDRN